MKNDKLNSETNPDIKSFAQVEFKAEGELGIFQAIFSRFNVIDKDGDVTLPGAFTDGQKVKIAYWGHRWSDLPVGVGVIHADEEKAWVDGKFFIDTDAGMETYKTVKNLGDLQEWSYGFKILDDEIGDFEGKQVRILKQLDVYEVSPVLIGAGVGTGTTSLKSANSKPQSEVSDTDETKDSSISLHDDETVSSGKSSVSETSGVSNSGLSVDDYKKLFQILTNIGE